MYIERAAIVGAENAEHAAESDARIYMRFDEIAHGTRRNGQARIQQNAVPAAYVARRRMTEYDAGRVFRAHGRLLEHPVVNELFAARTLGRKNAAVG